MPDAGTMRVVLTGATGNIGTSLISQLTAAGVGRVVGVARRAPEGRAGPDNLEWVERDVAVDELDPVFRDADVVIHLAWLFQPTHDPVKTWTTNVLGSKRVFEAALRQGVPAVVYSSSVGAYSPGPKDDRVDERWPTDGWPDAAYTREKAYVERVLDVLESRHPGTRIVRVRPGFVFKRESATQQRRLFAGPFVPRRLIRPELLPVVPDIPGLRMQAVHSDDVADGIWRAALSEAAGAFNLASEPIVDAALLGQIVGARPVTVPAALARTALAVGWWAHLVPATRGLVDAVLHLPIMDTSRARRELGWQPRFTSRQALEEVMTGMREGAGAATVPLAPDSVGSRMHEVSTGVGREP
jgi:nucleoside-diphosphate-sugar epimerase